MTIRNSVPLKLIGWLLLALLLRPAPALAQGPAPFDPRFGLVDSYVNIDEANAAGAGWTRIFLRWDVIQPAGPGDWKPANVPDPFIDAEIAAGREVAAVLIGTPAWATDSGQSTAVPPMEHWGRFVSQIAAQYRGRINHWIIWHQPDITNPAAGGHTWDGSEADYYYLLKEAWQKIKAVDPAMQVHLAGLTYTYDRDHGTPQYLTRLLTIAMADPQAPAENYYFDAVSYHLYYQPRQILDALTEVRAILTGFGLSQPIWLTETNAPPTTDPQEPPTSPGGVPVSLDEQAAFVIQATAMALAGGAERLAFNKLRNETVHPESSEPYGLLRGDNSRRPAFEAFRVVTRYFAGVRQADWQNSGGVYAVTLTRADQTTTVLWNTARTPARFSLPAIAPAGLLVDTLGGEQPLTAAGGWYTVDLPPAACAEEAACAIGGPPRLVVEAGSPANRPALTAPPAPSPATPTAAPVQAVPAVVTEFAPPTVTPLPLPTLTPAPLPVAVEPSPAAGPALLPDTAAPPPAVLPDSGPSLSPTDAPPEAAPTTAPPVNFRTVMKPYRLIWLFIVGLFVFVVSYGVQVAIWYRLRK